MTIVLALIAVGILLTRVVPPGKTAAQYKPWSEADFERVLAKRGLR